MIKIIKPIIFEEWKLLTSKNVFEDIVEPRYYISNFGRFYDSQKESFIIPYVSNQNGYCSVRMYLNDGKARNFYIHRLVLLAFNPNDNYLYLQGNHLNGDKSNNFYCPNSSINNLDWATPKENSQHAIDTGLNPMVGENANFAKITNLQAEQIAIMLTNKIPFKDIAQSIGCNISTVECISQGVTWKNIYKKYNLEKYKQVKDGFTDDEIEKICIFLSENINNYPSKEHLYRATIKTLFNRDMTNKDRISIIRYMNHSSKKYITGKYTF